MSDYYTNFGGITTVHWEPTNERLNSLTANIEQLLYSKMREWDAADGNTHDHGTIHRSAAIAMLRRKGGKGDLLVANMMERDPTLTEAFVINDNTIHTAAVEAVRNLQRDHRGYITLDLNENSDAYYTPVAIERAFTHMLKQARAVA